MNALELADELLNLSGDGAFKFYVEIATVLRQQQAEIVKLQEQNDRNSKYIRKKKQEYKHEIANLQFQKNLLQEKLNELC